MMKHIIITLTALLILSPTIWGQEAMTLEKAISLGLKNNYGIKIADQYIQIAENNNTWARAGKTPTVDLTGSFSNNFTSDNNPASFLQGSYYSGSLAANANANWVIYNGGRIRIAKDQLGLAVSQEKLSKAIDMHTLLRDIYQQYYGVIFQQEQLEVLQTNLALSNDRLAYEQTKREFGASNTYNLLQFENAILTDTTTLVNQIQMIEVAERNLYNLLDIPGKPDYEYQERLSVIPEPIAEEKLRETLSEENYTLKSLEMIASLNQLNTQMAQGARKPTVSLGASLGFAENGFNIFADNPMTGEPYPFLFSNRFTGSLGANASWNLYDGGQRKANIQNAKVQEQIDQMSLLEAKAELSNQLDLLISNYNNQLTQLEFTDQQIQVATKNLAMTEERFKAGQVSSLDFRNVQTQLLAASFRKVSAMYNLILTKSNIDFLVGKFE